MRTICLLLVVTLGLMLTLKFFVAPRYGGDVEARFLERIKYIPSQTEVLGPKTLARWLSDETHSNTVKGYVFPVLFPLDFIFLICLVCFSDSHLLRWRTGLEFCPAFRCGSGGPCRHATWRLILQRMVSIAAIFKSFVPLTDGSFRLLSALTATKIATVTASIAQVAFLGALNALLFLFPASRQL
jgi:hypothetical protein